MFLRRCIRRKNGKQHTYWALVESYRTGRGSHQRVVAYLGELKRSEQSGWAQLGRHLDKKARPEPSLFDPPHYGDPTDEEPVEVNLKGLRLERLRDFGDVWLALGLWRLLGLDSLLAEKMEQGREEVSWSAVAAILTIARFCEPSSELHIEDHWYGRTALDDLLGVLPDKIHTDRLYGGLVVTDDGIPLGYEVFDGNTHDSKTVEQIVEAMESKYGQAHRIWVMDRGMVSEENLAFLRSRDGSYLVGTPKSMLRQFEQYLTDKDWHGVQEGVEVKLVDGPDGKEVFVLARSRDRQQKEQAMHQRFTERMEAHLEKMQQSAASGRLKDLALAQRRLGRVQQRYWRSAGAFDVKIIPIDHPKGKAKLAVHYTRNQRWNEWAALSEGCYLLRTNLTGVDPQTLWKRYIQLTEAEWAFRITKDELVIRPIWHHKADRVKGHILVCFLAYVLWKTLAQWMDRAGLGDAPRTVLLELARIKSGDVVQPTRGRAGQPDKRIRLRCVTAADGAQKVLLNRLGLTLPQRLRRIDELVQM